jgi:hypothetical protein
MEPIEFEGKKPRFILEEFFSGKLKAQGMFFDRKNKVRRTFILALEGKPSADGNFVLSEDLRYDNGETLHRDYLIVRKDEHHYEATADGIVGKALIESYGNVLRWSYKLETPVKDKIYVLTFDDWMYLQEDGVMINRALAYKFGIQVGELVMVVNKAPQGE